MAQSEDAPIVHRLLYPDQIDAIEYPLPALSIPADIKPNLHPWIGQFVGLDRQVARAVLAERWQAIAEDRLQTLRDHLLEQFAPRSIVIREGTGWLLMEDPNIPVSEAAIGDFWLVAPPPSLETLDRCIDQWNLQNVALLRSFALYFTGLREDIPPMSGCFFMPEEWQPLASLGWEGYIEDCKHYEQWANAIMLWVERGSNTILVSPSGKVGAWWFEFNAITPYFDTFEAFVEYFTNFIQSRRYPFF